MEKICEYCKKSFEAKRRDTKYCGRSCQSKASRTRKEKGENILDHVCGKCGEHFTIKENAYNRRYCYNCMPETLRTGSANRQIMKQWALEYKGNCCINCGYNKCLDALEFHHLDPSQKEFSLSDRNLVLDWQKIKEELDKCILVCANCHREIHSKENNKND